MTKVRALLGVLPVLVFVALAAGCGPVSDQDQTQQEAKKKVESRGQQVRQEAKEKVEAKKQEAKKKVEAVQERVDDLQKDVDGLKKEVKDLQKKINAHEQKEQEQQIDQLKKALNELRKKVDVQEQQGQKVGKSRHQSPPGVCPRRHPELKSVSPPPGLEGK